MTENQWCTIVDYVADREGDIRDLVYFIKKGDRVILMRKQTVRKP